MPAIQFSSTRQIPKNTIYTLVSSNSNWKCHSFLEKPLPLELESYYSIDSWRSLVKRANSCVQGRYGTIRIYRSISMILGVVLLITCFTIVGIHTEHSKGGLIVGGSIGTIGVILLILSVLFHSLVIERLETAFTRLESLCENENKTLNRVQICARVGQCKTGNKWVCELAFFVPVVTSPISADLSSCLKSTSLHHIGSVTTHSIPVDSDNPLSTNRTIETGDERFANASFSTSRNTVHEFSSSGGAIQPLPLTDTSDFQAFTLTSSGYSSGALATNIAYAYQDILTSSLTHVPDTGVPMRTAGSDFTHDDAIKASAADVGSKFPDPLIYKGVEQRATH